MKHLHLLGVVYDDNFRAFFFSDVLYVAAYRILQDGMDALHLIHDQILFHRGVKSKKNGPWRGDIVVCRIWQFYRRGSTHFRGLIQGLCKNSSDDLFISELEKK